MQHSFIGRLGDCSDPRLACALIQDNVDRIVQTYLLSASFATGAVDETVVAVLDEPICDDFLITDVRFQIRRPTAFAGSPLKAQSDVNNAKNSGIDVDISLVGGLFCKKGKTVITNVPTPIELLARGPNGEGGGFFPEGSLFGRGTIPKIAFTNRRALAADEIPTTVFFLFVGISLGCSIASIDPAKAQAIVDASTGRKP